MPCFIFTEFVLKMTRTHKRKPGNRKYRDYTDETLQKCLEAVRGGKLTLREAEKEFGIHRNTIHDRLPCDDIES
mgnify:CR=1 FL=1